MKTGVNVEVSPALTLRAGYNYSGQAFPPTETFFNLLAPATVRHHVTAGATWRLQGGKELSVAYVHAFEATVDGQDSIGPSAGGGNANLRMHQDSVGLAFGWSKNR